MTATFLDDLQVAARAAEAAETTFRREMATRIAALEQARAFAFRRVNLMKAIAEVVAAAESEDMAVAHALATLRSRLGWDADSEARAAVLTRFASVAQAVFASLMPAKGEAGEADVGTALAEFETWYAKTYPTSFWALFETYISETPRVDF